MFKGDRWVMKYRCYRSCEAIMVMMSSSGSNKRMARVNERLFSAQSLAATTLFETIRMMNAQRFRGSVIRHGRPSEYG